MLKGVSGIGPRLALNILSGIPVDELENALRAGDVTRLVAVPGVGKKTAERLVVELREKVGAFENGHGFPANKRRFGRGDLRVSEPRLSSGRG